MAYISRKVSAFTALALFAAPVYAETLQEAFASAYATNPSLITARANLRATDEGVPTARAGMRPNLNVTVTGTTTDQSINGTPTGQTFSTGQVALNASQSLYDGGQTENSIESAISDVNASRSRLKSVEQTVLLNTVTSYMNVRRDQQFVTLAESNIRLINEQLRAAQDRFEVGEVTRTDVSQAEARLAQAQADLAARQGQLARSIQSYRRVVGEFPGKLAEPPVLPPLPETLQAAVQQAMDFHPDIKAAQFDEEAARHDIKTAQGALLPQVTLSGSVSYQEGGSQITNGQTTASVQAQVVVPIYQGGAEYANIRRTQALQGAAMSTIHDASRTVREAVENAWSDLMVARSAIRAGRQQVKAALLAFEGVREEAKLGARTTIDVLDAEQDLLDARSDLVSSLRDEYVAGYSLISAVGSLTVADQGVGVDPYDPSVNYNEVNDKYYGFKQDELTKWDDPLKP
ncbi:MAG: TolC family outer membrane protein [Pseudomonadota bacterium]